MEKMTVEQFAEMKVAEMREYLGVCGVSVGSRATRAACLAAYEGLMAAPGNVGQGKTAVALEDAPEIVTVPAGDGPSFTLGVDAAALESRAAASVLLEKNIENPDDGTPPKGRADVVKAALRRNPSIVSLVRAAAAASGPGNRRQRRRAHALVTQARRACVKAGVTIEEVVALET